MYSALAQNIKPNKDGYYRATFSVIDTSGNKKRIVLRDKDRISLERKLTEKKYEYEKGLLVVNGNSTVEKWAYEWLNTYKVNILQKQKNGYKSIIKNYIIPKIGNLQIKDVKSHHIQSILNQCADMSKTQNTMLYAALNGMFSKAVVSDMITKNPCAGIEKPKGKSNSLRALTEYEEKIFLKTCKKHHRGTMFKMILKCGLRPGEVRALTCDCIDFQKHEIKIKAAVESGSKNIKSTKTEKGLRIVPIPYDYEKELKEIMPKSGLVFHSDGKLISEKNFRRAWSSFKRLMNIEAGAKVYRNQVQEPVIDEEITPYYLRHTYCTHLAEKGIDIRTAQYLMGHADIKVTANIYTHVTNEMLERAKQTLCAKDVPKRKFKLHKPTILKD